MSKITPGPWKFERQQVNIDYAKMKGMELAPHDGYCRDNDGGWIISGIAKAFFKGKAKRGQTWNAQDDEGQANAFLISTAPDMLEELKRIRDTGRIDQDSLSVIIAKAEGKV